MAVATGVQAESPFTIRGWDIERFDPEHVIRRIDDAAAAGMNTISLSHEIVMNAEEILHDWHRYKHLRRFCQRAHTHDMKAYLWNHQINNPPEELRTTDADGIEWLDLDHPTLERWLYDRYQRVVDRVPELDGIVLSMTESEWQIHRDISEPYWFGITRRRVRSEKTPAERMAWLINTMHRSLSARGKRLIVRDFLRSPKEFAAFREALKDVPDDVWVFSKCVPNDFQYRYPPNPLLGNVSPRVQMIELDLTTELGGALDMHILIPGYIKQMAQLARDRGVAGFISRTDDGFHTNLGTPSEFNVFAYSQLLHDPDVDVDALYEEFFVNMYGDKAAPVAIEVLKETFDLGCALAYTLGFWTGIPPATIHYADSHLINHSTALWSDDPSYKAIERLLVDSGPEAIRRAVEEKQEAARTAQACLQKLDVAKDSFDPLRFSELRATFESAHARAQIGEHWVRLWLAHRWHRSAGTNESKSTLEEALDKSRAYVEHAVATNQVSKLERFNASIDVDANR